MGTTFNKLERRALALVIAGALLPQVGHATYLEASAEIFQGSSSLGTDFEQISMANPGDFADAVVQGSIGPLGGNPFASTIVQQNGVLALRAIAEDEYGGATGAGDEPISGVGGVVWKEQYENSSADPMAYFMTFSIPIGELATNDPTDTANYEIDITVDGTSVWSSTGDLIGCSYTSTGTSLPIDSDNSDTSDTVCAGRWIQFDDLTVSDLSLGVFAAGASFELEYTATVSAEGGTTDNTLSGTYRNLSRLGDPGEIDTYSPISVRSTRVSEQIPEPTTLALMGLGLAGIGYKRRQLKKA